MSEPESNSFQAEGLLHVDRIMREVDALKEQFQAADEFLLMAHARVQKLLEEQGPGIPHVLLQNNCPQSIGLAYGWADGRFVIRVSHRGQEGMRQVPPGQEVELEVGQ